MKILMVLDHEFPPDVRVENEIESLIKFGHEIHIACYTRENRVGFEKLNNNTYIHRKKISTFIYKTSVGILKFPFYFNFWRKFISELFLKYNFDAIHIHDLPLAKIGHEFSKKHKVKFVLDLHENWPALLSISQHTNTVLGKILSSQKQWRKYEKTSCNNADIVITVVEESKKRISDLGVENDKIFIVSNTLNLNHFNPKQGESDKNFITALYSGGVNKHRGLQYVIKSIKYLNDLPKPFRLWIIGTGSYIDDLKKKAKQEGVINQIEFMGWKPFGEMQNYFYKADLFLIPHKKSEHTDSTIPHKLFQYMYCKRPIIASNCNPIERIIKESKSGLIYKYDDPLDFSTKVKSLFDNKTNNNIDLDFSFNQVISKYNWINDEKQLLKIYKNR